MKNKHLADRNYAPSPLNATAVILDGAAVLKPQRRKVCLYGASLFRDQAPLEDPDWEVWGINLVPPLDRHGRLRADRWFDLHQRKAQTEDDLRWIRQCPVPIYLPDDLLDASPMAVPFPLESIERQFGGYWTCTFAYQIALALHEGFTDIGLFGVELALGTLRERTVEWACLSYWLGRAEGAGVFLHLPGGSTVCQHFEGWRYGLEYDEEKDIVDLYTDATCHQAIRQLKELARGGKELPGVGG